MIQNKIKVSLSKDLREKYHIRSFPVAKGDIVTVRTGGRKEEGGKVIDVNHASSLVSVEGLSAVTADGKQKEYWITPEKIRITRIDLSRRDRIEELRRLGNIKKIAIEKELEEDKAKQDQEAREQEAAEAAEAAAEPAEVAESEEHEEEPEGSGEGSGEEPEEESSEEELSEQSEKESDDEDSLDEEDENDKQD